MNIYCEHLKVIRYDMEKEHFYKCIVCDHYSYMRVLHSEIVGREWLKIKNPIKLLQLKIKLM